VLKVARSLVGTVAVFWIAGTAPTVAQSASMVTGPAAQGPAASYVFCRSAPHECSPSGPKVVAVALTDARWGELQHVNASVNSAISERSDLDLYGREDVWTLPTSGKGDCEDFALLKRKRLIEYGWPSSTLLITTVTTSSGEGHAVLTVVTDRGDYVLDSRTASISLWARTGYEFYTRQSQSNPQRWVWIEPGSAAGVAGPVTFPRRTAAR
jgi:predicted transglutaminase-like cysteine proteinase